MAVIVPAALDVHPDANAVRRVFLARQRFWRAGIVARPVNQRAQSPLREAFSRAVLGGRVQDFAGYWNDQYFHGTAPPPTLASDEAVLRYVTRTPGAIGYVTLDAARAAGDTVRIVLVFALR